VRQLTEAVGVNRRTVMRWQVWRREGSTASAIWQIARAAFMPPVEQDRLPAALIERFRGEGAEPLIASLRFIAPGTGGKVHARSATTRTGCCSPPRRASIYGLHSLDPQERRA
jgi:hypothetical protein